MRRVTAILLLIAFAALGSGLLEGLHLRTHVRERAAAKAAIGGAASSSVAPQSAPDADDGSCELCAQLHLPQINSACGPVLVCLGLLVAVVTPFAPQLAPQRVAIRLDCRGPPVL